MSGISIGVDTGGTFTDLVLIDPSAGRQVIHKLPTTPDDPARGILEGVRALLDSAGVVPSAIDFLVHGTTLATNAMLQRRYAKTGLLTTEGFRDVLEIGRQRRPSFYNLDVSKPVAPATRDCIFEVAGRLDERGVVVTELDEAGVAVAADALKEKGVTAVAVCFMHAYANPLHEERARDILLQRWPEVYVCTSAEVLREFREFERFSSACFNASLLPVIDKYLERFESGLRTLGVVPSPLVMQSNGGAVSVATVRAAPISTFFSGPAGGVIAAANIGKHATTPDLISFDMGGTSTDVSLIRDGVPTKRGLREMAGFPVRVPTLDIHTIGAGGGSIAWVDPGGLLKVGPHSAGADPGPALYGRGGIEPTVTDANVVLGRLSGASLIGGAMTVFPDKSKAALSALGAKIGLDTVATAGGVIEIVNVNMMGAVRVVSIERGEDPRNCALVAFGGAGPLHAVDIAREMGMTRVIVPPRPGLLSAIGLLGADRRGDFSVTRLVLAAQENVNTLREGFDILARQGATWREAEALPDTTLIYEWAADFRYFGQAFELTLPVAKGHVDEPALENLVEEFHRQHKSLNGYAMPDRPVEIVTLRLGVAVERILHVGENKAQAVTPVESAVATHRQVWFSNTGFVDTPVYERERLGPRHRFTGPALVEQTDSTTVVPPGSEVLVDGTGCLNIQIGGDT
ncbi:hydantoinase/oxoprolinase family protein [Alphaproteobacteria bacterium]|nr:hydantoinase/oxoprolinase family protein [Alphaproteobacteria bacterium]